MVIEMGTKYKINIQLNQKEYALVHYEMQFINASVVSESITWNKYLMN